MDISKGIEGDANDHFLVNSNWIINRNIGNPFWWRWSSYLSSDFDQLVWFKSAVASSIFLLTVLPSLIVGAFNYYRQDQINTKIGNQMLLTAIPVAVIGSLVSKYIPAKIYQLLIGIILVLLGIHMLLQKQVKSAPTVKKRAQPIWRLRYMAF